MQISDKEWLKPKPLRVEKEALPVFPVNCLPAVIKAMALSVAETTSTDTAMAATALLSSMSYCFSGVYRMYGKEDHSEPVTLYSLIIASPAERKSPVLKFVKSPFLSFNYEYNQINKEMIYACQEERKKIEREIKKMQDSGEYETSDIAEKRVYLDHMNKRNFRRICVDDITPEGLAEKLESNGSLLMISEEAGVFKNFGGRYNNGTPNVDLILKCWGGEMFIKDRCNSEPTVLSKPYLSVCLCGQPYILDEVMNNNAFLSSGLVARFLYCFPKSMVGTRSYDTRPVDSRVTEAYHKLVNISLKYKFEFTGDEIPLRFHEDARKAFSDYYDTAIEPALQTEFAECPDWGGKYHGLILRLCGLLHCIICICEGVKPEERNVDLMTLGAALDIAVYYKMQARYAYGLIGGDSALAAAEYILKRIRANSVTEATGRELLHLCRKFRTMDEMSQPLQTLIEYGYIRQVRRTASDGKKAVNVYEVNPNL